MVATVGNPPNSPPELQPPASDLMRIAGHITIVCVNAILFVGLLHTGFHRPDRLPTYFIAAGVISIICPTLTDRICGVISKIFIAS